MPQPAASASAGGDFLSSIAPAAFNMLTSWATGGFKQRPQWRDLEFMNDVQNRLWPDEIKRQGDYLAGLAPYEGQRLQTLAPSQAAAHNTFQDATYLENVGRETQGIKNMSTELGMSPWELTGQGGSAAPVQAYPQDAQGPQGTSQMGQYLAGLTPLKIAQMNNQAALTGKMMDNQTALKIEGIRQGGYNETTGKGNLVEQTIEKIKNETDVLKAQEQQIDVQMLNNVITTIAATLPEQTLDMFGSTFKTRPGAKALLNQLYSKTTAFKLDETRTNVEAATRGLPPDDLRNVRDTIIRFVEGGADMANTGMDVIGHVTGAIQDTFLPNQGKKK